MNAVKRIYDFAGLHRTICIDWHGGDGRQRAVTITLRHATDTSPERVAAAGRRWDRLTTDLADQALAW